jgi:hypothetical protein
MFLYANDLLQASIDRFSPNFFFEREIYVFFDLPRSPDQLIKFKISLQTKYVRIIIAKIKRIINAKLINIVITVK